jgi:signal transduction histidine kinase/ligand-binding sensor domain-containing protein
MEPNRTPLGRSAAAVLAAALVAPCAFALNPSLDISQYAHTSWRLDEGFFKGAVHSIAQTPDGFLWLGTEFGLVRFDGVRTVQWPIDESLPATQIRSLLAGRDGTLWIGTARGLASMKEGNPEVRHYAELDGQTIFGLVEDRAGNVWAAGWSPSKSTVCSIGKGCTRFDRGNGSLGGIIGVLYGDSKENIWLGTADGVWRWGPGPPKFYSLPGESGFDGLAEHDDGTLLIVKGGAVSRLVDGHVEVVSHLPGATREFHVRRMLRDRDGGLWIGTTGRGLVHIHQGRTEMFTRTEGLSGEDITTIFEDRDGNIWVGNFNGLDRFRDTPVQTYTERDGLWSTRVVSVLATRDGSIWMRTLDGLSRLKNRVVTVYREHNNSFAPAAPGGTASTPAVNGFRRQGSGSLYEDAKGRIWVSTLSAVSYLVNDRFLAVRGIPGGRVHSIVSDRAGRVWFAHQDLGLFRWQEDGTVQQISWSQLGRSEFADALAADPLKGGMWVGFIGGGLLYFQDGRILRSYTSADGLAEGRVNDFRIESDGTLWVTAEGGLSRLKNGRLVTLTVKHGLPCNRIHWTIEDDFHYVWIYTACGLVRISRSELDACAAAIERDKNAPVRIHPTVFDGSDGLQVRANAGGFSPHATKSSDGKLWFFPLDGLSSIDPGRLPLDSSPPPVFIEQLRADRLIHSFATDSKDRLVLPPLVRDLAIEYTALSIAAPEKLRFRYMLAGRDHDWTDAGIRRQAFYNDLQPGNYRFLVGASRNNGIWNQAGASLDFRVAAAYYQTRWFQAACLLAFVIVLAMLYQFRLRQFAHHFRLRTEERVSERTRIARDLHDTLLQSLQSLLLNFHSVTYLLPNRPVEARDALETAIEHARQAITEGRNAVEGLRSSRYEGGDLERSIGKLGRELAAHYNEPASPDFHVNVEGATRSLAPIVGSEIGCVAIEAVRNAFVHARAQRIEVEISYNARELRLRVRDNGKGIDPKIFKNGRDGHYGIDGMYERAKLVGGKLVFWSELGSGTEVELTVRASIAYAKGSDSRAFAFRAANLFAKLRRILS